MFPAAFAAGITLSEFKHMTPKQLECCIDGYRQRLRDMDALIWQWFGSYGVSAIAVAVEKNLAGRKARGKYIEEPIMKKAEDKNRKLTEEEAQKAREKLLNNLLIREANFKLQKARKEKDAGNRN